MRIGIDARICFYNKSGLFRYAQELIRALAEQSYKDKIVVFQSWRQKTALVEHPKVQVRSCITPPHSRLEPVLLPLEAKANVDFVHCVDFYAPFGKSLPIICTAQDVYFLSEPKALSSDARRFYGKFLDFLPRAARVVCSSQSTKRDLLEYSDISADTVSVVYPGFLPDGLSVSTLTLETVRKKYSLTSPAVLFVGTIEPRKNIDGIIRSFEIAAQRSKRKLSLYLVGRKGFRADEYLELINDSPYRNQIAYLGELANDEVAALYQLSDCVLFPSHCEGFGYPVLEGFAARTPVITSNLSSTKEIAADAAVLVNPLDYEQIADELISLFSDQDRVKTLTTKAELRLKEFSWDASAAAMKNVYRQVYGRV